MVGEAVHNPKEGKQLGASVSIVVQLEQRRSHSASHSAPVLVGRLEKLVQQPASSWCSNAVC
jgi:hypothetical protein